MLKLGLATLLASAVIGVPAHGQATSTSAAPASPTTFLTPDGWTRTAPAMTVTVLNPPETDLHVAIVEVEHAADAKGAATSAWQAYRPAGIRPVKLVTDQPAREGWDGGSVINYETSPNEHLTVVSFARRSGNHWTVAILEGNEATVEKRGAALNQIIASMRPTGYKRETFVDRKAHALDDAKVAELLKFVRTSAHKLKIPGVGIALIDHGKIVYEGGIGVREYGKPQRVDARTKFMIASNTKSMSTLLLAKLVDEGKIKWDEPVTSAYPDFRLGSDETTKSVLIRHLVCACTGLPRKDMEFLFTTTRSTPASETFTLLAGTQPTSGFGQVFQYNNLMASAAGYVAGHLLHPEMELGRAYDLSMKENILDPLGMHDTTMSMDDALKGDHASPHSIDLKGRIALTGQDINFAIAPYRPAGGAWSTPHDMILYVQNELTEGRLANGSQLVTAANLLARRKRGVTIGEDQWYGMGLMEDARTGVSVIHHGGDLEGYHSDMYAIPSAEVGAVLLTNSDRGPALRGPFMRRLLEVMYDGKPEAVGNIDAAVKSIEADDAETRKKLITPVPKSTTTALAPAYENPDLGGLAITRKGTALMIRATAWKSEAALRKNQDKTRSLVTISPGLDGFDFVIGKDDGGKRTLTTRDGQHVYIFTETKGH